MRRLGLTTIALALSACGAQAFDAQFAERQEPHMSGVLEELAAAPPRATDPVVAAVTADPPGLLLWDLRESRERWRVATEVRATPIVAGDHVVCTEAEGIVVRSIADGGRVLAIRERDVRLIGADGEAGTLVITLARGEGEVPLGSVVGVRGAEIAWSHELPLSVGVPAVVGTLVLVPWAQQRLSVLDATTGVERVRVRLEHAVVGYAFHHGTQTYVGQHGLFALTPGLLDDERRQRAGGIEPRGRPLPGQPPSLPDAYLPRMEIDSARNRVRLAWTLGDGEPATLADDALYYVFYRLVYGLVGGEDEVRWVIDRGHDVVGVDVTPGALVVVGDDGSVATLAAANGAVISEVSLGAPVVAADVRADGLAAGAPPATAPVPLRVQLETAAAIRDSRIGAGRALAVRFLSRDPAAEVTAQLIALCSDRSDTSQARTAACDALATRQNGDQHVLTALREGGSYLEQRPAPPIGALARAAATMHLRNALPYLITHLEDPSTPSDELPGLFDGLAQLGDPRAVAPVEAYVRLYHADATDAPAIEALAAASRALVVLAPARAEPLRALADDPMAPAPARERLAVALVPVAAEAAPTPAAPARPTPAGRAEPVPEADPALPSSVTTEMAEQALAPAQAGLRRCLERPDGDPHPVARLMLMVNEEGAIQTVTVTPSELQACVEPLVRDRSFPRTRRGRQVVIHTVRR
jgi:hypothetical protein